MTPVDQVAVDRVEGFARSLGDELQRAGIDNDTGAVIPCTRRGVGPAYVRVDLDEAGAVTLARHLEVWADAIAIAAVVEAIGDLHPMDHESGYCPSCSVEAPCQTRQLLRELPGGAS